MMAFKLPLAGIKFSTNKIYAGIHWTQRKRFKDDIFFIVRAYCKPAVPIKSYPVFIHYRFLFETAALDTTNTAGMAKCIEDSLCAIGILKNDDPRFVAATLLEVESRKSKKQPREDWVEITISDYEQRRIEVRNA